MFQTLKAQSGALGDSEYVVRSSVAASDKVKATKKQPACTRCKMKKLKCIMEADSCEKCMEGGVACSSRGTGGPERRASPAEERRASTLADRRNSPPVECRVNRHDPPISNDCISVFSKAGFSDESPLSGISYDDSVNSLPTDHNELDSCMIINHDDDPCSTFIDSSIGTPSFMADLSNWPPNLAEDVRAVGPVCVPDTALQDHEFDICFCVDMIIAANATIQVKLVWGTSLNGCSTSSIDDMLHCQKNVLASCETFFECKKCSLRSDYMVLAISMCREMVNSLKALEVITSPESQSSRRPIPDTESSSKGKLAAGGWRLEDDDEIEIMRHLIQIRIAKLKKLVSQLEHTVGANHASYAWIVGSLRKSLNEKLGSVVLTVEDMMDLNR